MRVLAVVPDGNVLDILRWTARWNPELTWDVVTIMPDALREAVDWTERCRHLLCDYRETCSYPQDPVPDFLPLDGLRYEAACCGINSPLIGNWFHYHESTLDGMASLALELSDGAPCDIVVTWGERGWYNEIAANFAQIYGLPHCRLERATFPGMLVADGTGLEQGKCDLSDVHGSLWRQIRWNVAGFSGISPRTAFDRWLSVARWQGIEAQPRTTLGMARDILDGRPSVFVPLQVPVDTNMIFRTSEVCRNYDLLQYVREKYPDHQIIVKKHPADGFTCPDKLKSYCDEWGMTLVDMDTRATLQTVDQVVSINSQVIVEAWMQGLQPEVLGQPAFDLPDEPDKEALLYTLRFSYYIEPHQLTEILRWIANR